MRTMRAAAIDAFGTPDVLTVHRVPVPQVGAGEVLVRVINAGVQLTDAAVRAGWTPPGATITFPQILGSEFSGIVEATAEDVTSFRAGDHVLGFRLLGCYAEYVSVPATQLIAKPDNVDWATAGVLSASGQTAHTAVEHLGVSAGDTVVVHGAAGGVGTVFVQLAGHQGAHVIGTASAANHDYLRSLGVTPIEYGPHQLEQIQRSTPDGVDAVFEAAGHENLLTAIELVDDRQRIATIVDMALANDLGCQIVRSDRSAHRLADLAARVSRGTLKIHVRHTYPLDHAAEAHRDVETGHGRGKIALAIGEPR